MAKPTPSATAPGDAPVKALTLSDDERELVRALILADPDLVLADGQVMRALIGDKGPKGRQVVDLRDRLVERLENRLDKLVHTNRSVIAAAYENVAGTSQLHRAVLSLIEAGDLAEFLRRLTLDVPRMVGVEHGRLCLEAEVDHILPADALSPGLDGRVLAVPEGTAEAYLTLDGEPEGTAIVLRATGEETEMFFGANPVRSEAVLRLDIAGSAGLYVFGSSDPDRFGPDQGTDLLGFFAGVIERLLVHRLADADADAGPGPGTEG